MSVTALTDMLLLRIDKNRFISLIRDEVLCSVSYPEIQHQMSSIQVLDVRSPDEYNAQNIENSINIPLFSLRMQLKTLNRKKKVIVVCQDGGESGTAAFLLIKNKFNAFVLEGGINTVFDVSNNQTAVFDIDEGQETQLVQEPEVLLQSVDQSEEKQGEGDADDNFIVGIDLVKQENEELILENQKLIANYSNLMREKEQLEQDYRILERQTEKLKSVLKKFKVDT